MDHQARVGQVVEDACARGRAALRVGDIDSAMAAAEEAMLAVPADGTLAPDAHFRLQQPGWLLRDQAIQLGAEQRWARTPVPSPPTPSVAQMVRVRLVWAAGLWAIVIVALGASIAATRAESQSGEVWLGVAVHAALLAGLLVLLLGAMAFPPGRRNRAGTVDSRPSAS